MVSREQVEHVARLAKLSVSQEEAEQLAGELGAVLDYVAQLDELEGDAATPAIPPTDAGETHVAVVSTPRRPDEVLGAWALTFVLAGLTGPAAAAPEAAAVQIRIQAAPALTPEAAQRAAEIYGVLRAGVPESDAALNSHLWDIARSLAERADWAPPRVTVRLVPQEAPAR